MKQKEEILRGLRPRVTELSGNEEEADAATFAASCALLRRYTSRTYIAEAAALFGTVADAFEAWPRAADHFGEQTLIEWMLTLKQQRAAYVRGLAQFDAGYAAAAYASIALASSDMVPRDPRDERNFSLSTIVRALGSPMVAVGEKLGAMAGRISATLRAEWAYQNLMNDLTSIPSEASVAAEDASETATGLPVPKTGIWIPTTIRYGCPNFLIAGQPAPPMKRACKRYDYAARDGGGLLDPPRAARSDYEYVEEPTIWRMVWCDKRSDASGRTGSS